MILSRNVCNLVKSNLTICSYYDLTWGLCGHGYSSYRYSNRNNTKNNTKNYNKELRREHIENFVISELHSKIFNDDVIPGLVEQLNEHQNSLNTERQAELSALKAKLQDVSKQLDNIISAVAQGFTQASFLEKMTELEEQKNNLSSSIKELEMDNKKQSSQRTSCDNCLACSSIM